jgi:hypothetical protein
MVEGLKATIVIRIFLTDSTNYGEDVDKLQDFKNTVLPLE